MPHCNRRRLVWAGLAALLSAPPAAAQAANAPKWKFDAGVSVSPLFKAYLDAPSCCNPIGGWATVGQGRFRLQMDYARNERQSLSYPAYYEEREGREIAVERAYLDEHVEQAAGVALYWRLLRNRRLTPHLLLGMSLARLADRPCVAEGLPGGGLPESGQRLRVEFSQPNPCAGEPFLTRFRIWPQVGAGVDYAPASRFFVRAQIRLLEARVGLGVRF